VALGGGKHVRLDLARDERVTRLEADERRCARPFRRPPRLDDLAAAEVGATDVADLALTDEVVEGGHGLLDGSLRIREVALVEIHVLRAQAAQTRIERTRQMPARQADVVRTRPLGSARLRGDHYGVALGCHRPPYDLLGLAARVDIGRVDEVVPCVEEGINDATGFRLFTRRPGPSEVHRPEAGAAHFQARPSHSCVGHGG
jgi:hypothetical protein